MSQQKVKVKALQPFSHGNVDARQDGVYAMNKGDAQELEKLGFLSIGGTGEAEQTQIDQPPQVAQMGDVVADNGPDVLGTGEKMEPAAENKAAPATRNKGK